MEGAQAASGGGQAGAALPMEPLGSPAPGLAQEERRPGGPESGPAAADQEATGAGPDLSGAKQLPSPRPARLRPLPASLGYGAFRRQPAAAPEPPSPGPAAAEHDGEAAGTEPAAPGSWAPVELQVDVLVKPVGAAGGSHAPSPAPSRRRFITVPVPESPACPRHAAPAGPPPLPRTASLGSTWGGRGSPLPAPRAQHGPGAEGQAGPAEGGAEAPGSPTCRCRCRCNRPGSEDAALLPRAEDGDPKLPRAVRLVGLPMYLKSLRWALVIMAVLLAVSMVAVVVLASRAGARCRPCPRGWLWSGEHCYYLSTKAQAWEASQAFCSAHRATLPLLVHTQDFLGRYPVTKHSWVGARRGPRGWHWINGDPLPPQLLQEEDKDQPGVKCAALEGGKLVALDCASPRPWVCAQRTK